MLYSLLLATSLLATNSTSLHPVPQEGWTDLFDGSTLDGWVTSGGRYDGKAVWGVEDGTITGREGPNSAGGLIYTEKEYEDVEIELDCWITYPFDSGIFLRMVPRDRSQEDGGGRGPQVTIDYRPGGEVGGIYADGWMFHNPQGSELWRRDDWNRVRVRCVGQPPRVVVWLNGELLTDYAIPEHPGGFATKGRIGLQVHGARAEPESSVVRFRNVRVRELDAGDDWFQEGKGGFLQLTEDGRAAGWRSLFNGKDLTGWTGEGSGKGFTVRDGLMTFLTDGDSPHLVTDEDFQDFSLRLDFKISEMANSGLFLRAARDGSNPAYSGCEVQILDDFNWETRTNSTLQPYQFTGGLYGAHPPGVKNALRPLGEWNTYQIHYAGSRIQTVLNGHVLYDVDTHTLEGAKPPFAERVKAGFIGLQRHAPGGIDGDAYAWFRNIYIRPH